MRRELHFDIETFSSADIKKCGVYRYVESPDFEILMISYSIDDQSVKTVDLISGQELPAEFWDRFNDPETRKCAHNAIFERLSFRSYFGAERPIQEWECSQIRAAYCGLPLSLEALTSALNLGESGKLSTGKSLIRLFSVPCKPTRTNGLKTRIYPWDQPEKWADYLEYNRRDVLAEKEVLRILQKYPLPPVEVRNWNLDQTINDTGVRVFTEFAKKAKQLDDYNSKLIGEKMSDLSDIANPKSVSQLKEWIKSKTGEDVGSMSKENLDKMIEDSDDPEVQEILELRQRDSKSSAKKYTSILNTRCEDGRVHGLLQFYGANRTGRWAGRLVQLQNLPRNVISDEELLVARDLILKGDFDQMYLQFDNISEVLAQSIRSTFISSPGMIFAVADYAAIEARVVAWLAGETWRLEVFKTHGKIYEASASMMFDVPIDQIGKGSDLRKKGKVAELALGYGGGVAAMQKMNKGGGDMSIAEMKTIISRWRRTNPKIVGMWKSLEESAIKAIRLRKPIQTGYRGIVFHYDGTALRAKLPSGRELFYWGAKLMTNRFGGECVGYLGTDDAKKWSYIDTFGGKITENFVQAISRDVLANAMHLLSENGFKIVMHVHDEVICEISESGSSEAVLELSRIMGRPISWAPDLYLRAEGYLTTFYKKD